MHLARPLPAFRFIVLGAMLSGMLTGLPAGAAVFPCDEPGVRAAIAAGGGPHTFTCQKKSATVTTSSEIAIDNDVILDGEGKLTLDGDDSHRVFVVPAGITVELRNLRVTGGKEMGIGALGGGIRSSGALTLVDSTVSGNSSSGGGGGISSSGVLTLIDSTVSENTAGFGGGIHGRGTLTLINSTISKNMAGDGGGINSTGSLTLIDSTVSENTGGLGGGISHAVGTLTLVNSTVSRNSAIGTSPLLFQGFGGGIAVGFRADLINSTLSDNHATFEGSGALLATGMSLVASTISGNTTDEPAGAALAALPGKLGFLLGASNSVIDGDCQAGVFVVTIGNGGNVESPGDTCRFTHATDQVSVSKAALALGPLADNGGPTQTRALLSGSVALDAASCPPPDTDQRGVSRPQRGGCDVGSYEALPVLPVEIDIKPGSDENAINLTGQGVVVVAILGSDAFDPADVILASLFFEGATPVQEVGGHLEDVNGDGWTDLVSHYRTRDTDISFGQTEACLLGHALDGAPIESCDTILTIGP